MFNKRLSELAPGAMPFVVRAVVFKWIGLLATIVLMLVLGNAFQRVFDGGLANLDATSLGLIALAVCVRAVTSVLAANAGDRAALRAREQVRMAVYDKLLRLGPSYATSVSTSEAVQLSIEGAEQLQVYFGSFLPQLFFAALAPLTLFVVMLPLCWPAALVLLACVPLIPLLIMMVRRAAKAAADVYWGSYTDLGALFLEDIQGLTTLKIFRADAARHERMNDKAEKFRNATMQMLFVQLRSILAMDLVVFLGAAAGIVVAVVQLASGAIPFSTAFAIVFLSQEFFLPMRTLGSLFHAAMNGIAASKRMIELIDLQEPQRCEGTERPAGCTLECAGIGFTYDGHRQALENVSARFEQGAFTGIVGASGSGKSTLAAILSGTLAGYVGSVRIGGVDVRDIELDDLSRLITTVPTNGYLFKGTLRSNLALGNPSASDDEMLSALQRCKVLDFALASGGLDMPVSEGGQNLSGGQRQRICIARA
ncbi:MAG: ATP-binding cassette domain-containing protein, partial [Eggerthellaceae bacterium]|nr:ATP-binding cassette domain-containing protein [Eggerthellaceae bacterium]